MASSEKIGPVLSAELDEIDREIVELRRSISSTKTHGVLYYFVLVAIMFVGFTAGYATHSLVGAAIILIGLAVVAWREVTSYRSRTQVLNQLLAQKQSERRQVEERKREFDIEK
jgi:hypothetical protein